MEAGVRALGEIATLASPSLPWEEIGAKAYWRSSQERRAALPTSSSTSRWTWAALGGPIDQRPGSDDLGWAIYLLRYTGVATESVGSGTASFTGVAADNAVYSRAALSAVSNTWEDGFWEPTVHDALRAAGQLIGLDPALAVLHDNGYSARGFVLQRLLHGYRFGRDRARRHGPLTAGLYAAASPAVPLLFGRKVVARALGLREARRHLPGALPWLLVFLAAWSAGEVLGAQAGAFRGRGR